MFNYRIVIAGYKDDILHLYKENPEYGQKVLEFVNSDQYSIPQSFKSLAGWMRIDPSYDELSVMHSLDHIQDERLPYKINLKSKTITINDQTFATPDELERYLASLIRTSEPEVSTDTETDLVPIMQNQDGSIKVYKITGENAQAKATELGGDTSWCITKPGGMLQRYRKTKASTFYFVIDKNMEGTMLAKVAIDFNKNEIVELTDLRNVTGRELTVDIPGEKGKDLSAYSSYLMKKGIDIGAKNDNDEPLLKNEPLTEKELSDIEFNERFSAGNFTLEEFQQLFKGQNFRENRPEKLITSLRNYLPADCLKWLVEVNRPYTNKLVIQYLQSGRELPEDHLEIIKSYPKIFKEYKRIATVRLKRYKQLRETDNLIFTIDELLEILSIDELPLILVPNSLRTEELILKRLDSDNPVPTIDQLENFASRITPKIKEKIFYLIQSLDDLGLKEFLFSEGGYLYNLFFSKSTLNEIAYNVAKIAKDVDYNRLDLPRAVSENYKFYELLNKYGYKKWIHAFDMGQAGNMNRLTTTISFLIQGILHDFDFLKVIMDAEKNENFRWRMMFAILNTNRELYDKIISSKYKTYFPLMARTTFKLRGDMGLTEDSIFQGRQSISLPNIKQNQNKNSLRLYHMIKDQIPVGEQIPMQTEQVEQQRNPNKLVDIMKKLDDKGFYGLSDKLTQSLSPNQPLPDQRPRPQDVPVEFED
jgi:hypothetical protein